MHNYPLKFKTTAMPAEADLTILDAEKNEILFRPAITEAMQQGQAPCIIYTDKVSRQPLYTILFQEVNGIDRYSIRTPGEVVLGKLVTEVEHAWKVMDEHGSLLATIQEQSAWKSSCLFQLLTLPFDSDLENVYLKMLFPHRYLVELNDKVVLRLREQVSVISDDYGLKKSGEFTEREEALLLVSLIIALGLKE